MSLLAKIKTQEENLSEIAVFCYLDNHSEESLLHRIDYANHAFELANGQNVEFKDIRFVIIREPLFDSLNEYFDFENKTGNQAAYFKFKFTYHDGVTREGRCVKCKNADGLWHIHRYHQGHIYYILIPEIYLLDTQLEELQLPVDCLPQPDVHSGDISSASFDLNRVKLDEELLHQFSPNILHKLQAVPLYMQKGSLVVALADPSKNDTIQLLSFISGKTIEPIKAPAEQISKCLSKWIHAKNEIDALTELKEKGAIESTQMSKNEIENLGKQKGVIRLMHSIIQDAIERGVSDIHMHPRKEYLELLYRMDGVLVPIRKLNLSLHQALISRIKILARMDISEHRLPQDGRIELTRGEHSVDMRVSIMPTVFGESAVIRILDSSKGIMNLDKLGFNEQDTQTLQHLLHASYGMLLVTGPTGSGKSTTLYAAINELVAQGPHIITVEEPVEYQMDGVTQIPVNHKTGYTFARALRNILRHDPDIVMVGEIRDGETAKIAVESALTGHLVLSTLHTNSAASTITRLIEIGVAPYLLKDALIGVIAQRLVRKICPHCKTPSEVKPAIVKAIGADSDETFYVGKGCKECHHTGVAGRMSVYELLEINDDVKSAISGSKSALEIEKIALAQGMRPLGERALYLAREGKISAEEAYRVRKS